MRTIRQPHALHSIAPHGQPFSKSIGFVPTMGALHEGHLSLIRHSSKRHSRTIVSIFVNPMQFGPKEDFSRYPRNLRRDQHLAKAAGADTLFIPGIKTIYPEGFDTKICVDSLSNSFEGVFRPGHFEGITTVVALLFEMVRPTHSYFGQKDYQQLCVIRRMVADLRIPVKVIMRPTVRESDGLAMSSRNRYLNASQRRRAVILYKVLSEAKHRIRNGEKNGKVLTHRMRRQFRRESGIRLDYVAIVDSEQLMVLNHLHRRVALLGAIRIGGIRLIDNLLVDVP